MFSVPSALLEILKLRKGAAVGLARESERLMFDPSSSPRYTLAELLAASDYTAPRLGEEQEWVDVPAVGREDI